MTEKLGVLTQSRQTKILRDHGWQAVFQGAAKRDQIRPLGFIGQAAEVLAHPIDAIVELFSNKKATPSTKGLQEQKMLDQLITLKELQAEMSNQPKEKIKEIFEILYQEQTQEKAVRYSLASSGEKVLLLPWLSQKHWELAHPVQSGGVILVCDAHTKPKFEWIDYAPFVLRAIPQKGDKGDAGSTSQVTLIAAPSLSIVPNTSCVVDSATVTATVTGLDSSKADSIKITRTVLDSNGIETIGMISEVAISSGATSISKSFINVTTSSEPASVQYRVLMEKQGVAVSNVSPVTTYTVPRRLFSRSSFSANQNFAVGVNQNALEGVSFSNAVDGFSNATTSIAATADYVSGPVAASLTLTGANGGLLLKYSGADAYECVQNVNFDNINQASVTVSPGDIFFVKGRQGDVSKGAGAKQVAAFQLVSIEQTGPLGKLNRGTWNSGGTVYAVDDLVSVSGVPYVCIAAHSSGATFAADSANWVLAGKYTLKTLSSQQSSLPGSVLDLKAY